jgi:hypothetical protein
LKQESQGNKYFAREKRWCGSEWNTNSQCLQFFFFFGNCSILTNTLTFENNYGTVCMCKIFWVMLWALIEIEIEYHITLCYLGTQTIIKKKYKQTYWSSRMMPTLPLPSSRSQSFSQLSTLNRLLTITI